MAEFNIVSMSGGKDSTATLLVARELEVPNLSGVFADTGHEHPATYDYVHYLVDAVGVPIRWVKADFSRQIAGKRKFIETKWREKGVPEAVVLAALEVLHPTGNPLLDMCLWKGRFPSTKARFCTDELKRNGFEGPIEKGQLWAGFMAAANGAMYAQLGAVNARIINDAIRDAVTDVARSKLQVVKP